MQPRVHIIVSLTLGGLLWVQTKSFCAAALCFASGVIIDLDHIVEYGIHHGWRRLNLREIHHHFSTASARGYSGPARRFYFFLHANEYVVFFWILFFLTREICLFGLAVGYSVHMILDNFGNRDRHDPFHYYLLVRLFKKKPSP